MRSQRSQTEAQTTKATLTSRGRPPRLGDAHYFGIDLSAPGMAFRFGGWDRPHAFIGLA